MVRFPAWLETRNTRFVEKFKIPQQRDDNTTSNHRLTEMVKTVRSSLLLSLATSLVIPSQEDEWSACSVACLCRDDAQRNAERWIAIVRRRMPSG
jgi:hypothetical protein